MKATLFVKNIHRLYLCDDTFQVLENAFLACHHDKIVDFGIGAGNDWLDDATRVLDASGCIVIPAFIQAGWRFDQEDHRKALNLFTDLRKGGVETICLPVGSWQHKDLLFDVLPAASFSLPQGNLKEKLPEGQCTLSCQCARNTSMMAAAFCQRHVHEEKAERILKAMTCWPAQSCNLHDRGAIKIGALPDFLIFKVKSAEELFDWPDQHRLRYMVKRGIPVYPSIIIC
jgi:imidazolonepropionase-like amidohydrolase